MPEPDRSPRNRRDRDADNGARSSTADLPEWYYYGTIITVIFAILAISIIGMM